MVLTHMEKQTADNAEQLDVYGDSKSTEVYSGYTLVNRKRQSLELVIHCKKKLVRFIEVGDGLAWPSGQPLNPIAFPALND